MCISLWLCACVCVCVCVCMWGLGGVTKWDFWMSASIEAKSNTYSIIKLSYSAFDMLTFRGAHVAVSGLHAVRPAAHREVLFTHARAEGRKRKKKRRVTFPSRAPLFLPALKFEEVENVHKKLVTLRVVASHSDLTRSCLHRYPEKKKKKKAISDTTWKPGTARWRW